MNSYQCPLNNFPSLSWEIFVTNTALWVAQLWARTVISAWTKGKTQVRLHCAGPGMHGIQIASKFLWKARRVRKRRYRWSRRYRSRLRKFCQFQVTKQEKEGLRNNGASVLFILGTLGAWGWSSKQFFFYLSLVVSSQ